MSQFHGRRNRSGDWEWEGEAPSRLRVFSAPLIVGAILASLMLGYAFASNGWSFSPVSPNSPTSAPTGTPDPSCQPATITGEAQTQWRDLPTCTPSPTPTTPPIGTPSPAPSCNNAAYDTSLTSPALPNGSNDYTYKITGCGDPQIKFVKLSGCWSRDDIASIETDPGGKTAEILDDGTVKVSGLSGADLPLTITIHFKSSHDSALDHAYVSVWVGPGNSDGYTIKTGGPLCEPRTETPAPPATSTPAVTPSPAPTPPPADTPAPTPSPTPSPPPANSPPPATQAPAPAPETDITLVKTDDPDPAKRGGELTYTVTVNNISSVDAENVVVTDTPPGAVTFISATPSRGFCNGVCHLGTLGAGQAAVIQIVVTVNADAPGTFTNLACAATSTKDRNMDNNCDTEDTHVPGVAPTTLPQTSTPRAMPNTGGLPGDGGSSSWMLVLALGVGTLTVGGFVAAAAKRRAARSTMEM